MRGVWLWAVAIGCVPPGSATDKAGDSGDTDDSPIVSPTILVPTTSTPPTGGDSGAHSAVGPREHTAVPVDDSVQQLCVDTINAYRATLGLPPYARWSSAEPCADGQAASDGAANTPHGAFGACGEWAQNECPGWNGSEEQVTTDCLAMMWAEGPGADFNRHGHYLNMSSTRYTEVACGYATVRGGLWAVQDFR